MKEIIWKSSGTVWLSLFGYHYLIIIIWLSLFGYHWEDIIAVGFPSVSSETLVNGTTSSSSVVFCRWTTAVITFDMRIIIWDNKDFGLVQFAINVWLSLRFVFIWVKVNQIQVFLNKWYNTYYKNNLDNKCILIGQQLVLIALFNGFWLVYKCVFIALRNTKMTWANVISFSKL